MLEQLQAGHEGFSAGALAALKQSRHVLGSLADRIRVPDQYVTAIETALGHHLQLVLTEQPESAHQILADLNANKAAAPAWRRWHSSEMAMPTPALAVMVWQGEPASSSVSQPASGASSIELNGVPLPAMAVVESETSIRPLVGRLLGHDADRAGP